MNADRLAAAVTSRPRDQDLHWTWSLVWRVDEARAGVLAVVEALCDDISDLGAHGPDAWMPDGDPHRQ